MSAGLAQILRLFSEAVSLDFLADLAIKGSLILGMALLAVFLSRRGAAAVRHYILGLAIVGVGLLPLLTGVVPEWEISPLARPALQPEILPVAALQNQASPAPTASLPNFHPNPTAEAADIRIPWTSWVVVFWCLGALAMVARIAVGSAGSWWIIFRASPLEKPAVRRLAGQCRHEIRLRRPVRIRISSAIEIPFVHGLLRPRIVLPEAAATWPVERLRLVLLHELAHIKRGDLLLNTLVRAVSILNWFNPLFWITVRRAYLERERAADDRVLAAGAQPHAYARHLLEIGKALGRPRHMATAGIGMAHSSQLGRRIMDIVNVNKKRTALTWGRGTLIAIITGAMIIPLAGITGQAADGQLQGVTEEERNEIASTLTNFYDALTDGEDFDFVCEMYLADDYFEQPELTTENLGRQAWTDAFNNTMAAYYALGLQKIIGPPAVRSSIRSIRREGDRYIVMQNVDLLMPSENNNGNYIVKSLEHESIFVQENGNWKIARFDGGVSVMRMDVNNPHGPIFLIWVHDVDPATTPYGQMIFKIFPREYRTDGRVQIAFKLETDDGE